MSDDLRTPEGLAKFFHDTYESLAPEFNYSTRPESAVAWDDVPLANKRLMIAVCAKVLDVFPPFISGRCDSIDGVLRCQGEIGHAGAHWADTGRSPAVLRWGMRGYGCADPSCNRKPGHDLPHRDCRGRSWVPMDADDEDEA